MPRVRNRASFRAALPIHDNAPLTPFLRLPTEESFKETRQFRVQGFLLSGHSASLAWDTGQLPRPRVGTRHQTLDRKKGRNSLRPKKTAPHRPAHLTAPVVVVLAPKVFAGVLWADQSESAAVVRIRPGRLFGLDYDIVDSRREAGLCSTFSA